MIEIKKLTDCSINQLHIAFKKAFEGYPMPEMSKDALETMITRRGFSAEHSFGAFDKEELVSFIFNGVGTHHGQKTVYDTGTGTLKSHRGQGLAGKIFQHSLPILQADGVEQYLLEVLQDNTVAYELYKKQGFEIAREFNYYLTERPELLTTNKSLASGYSIQETTLTNETILSSFCDFEASWQNSFASIKRQEKDFTMLGIFQNHQLVGYGLIDPHSGDIPQLAIEKNHRRKGLATCLMQEFRKLNQHTILKVLNTEKGYAPMEEFMRSIKLDLTGLQYEMTRRI